LLALIANQHCWLLIGEAGEVAGLDREVGISTFVLDIFFEKLIAIYQGSF